MGRLGVALGEARRCTWRDLVGRHLVERDLARRGNRFSTGTKATSSFIAIDKWTDAFFMFVYIVNAMYIFKLEENHLSNPKQGHPTGEAGHSRAGHGRAGLGRARRVGTERGRARRASAGGARRARAGGTEWERGKAALGGSARGRPSVFDRQYKENNHPGRLSGSTNTVNRTDATTWC